MSENTRQAIHNRMRWIHAWLVDHKHGPHGVEGREDCVCAEMYQEMKGLWWKLNPHATVLWPRAGPRSGGGWANIDGRPEIADMMSDVEPDNIRLNNDE